MENKTTSYQLPTALRLGNTVTTDKSTIINHFNINDVALAAGDSLIELYTDDTILYTSDPSLDTVLTNLQTSFNAIQHSFRGLQLLLNVSKTKCMLFNRSLPDQHHHPGWFRP